MNDLKSISLLVIVVVCAGCASPIAGLFPPSPDQAVEDVYVIRHGRHVGIILPTAPVQKSSWPEVAVVGTPYVELGWADRYYNLSDDPEWLRIGVALCLPTRSILKVVPVTEHPTNAYTGNGLVVVRVSEEGFQRVSEFVSETYARDPNGNPELLTGDSQVMIYAAQGRYYFPKTSNTWTAKALRRAGCPISPIRCATADATFSRASQFGVTLREHKTVTEQLADFEQ